MRIVGGGDHQYQFLPMTVEPTSALPMHMGLCRGHVGVVLWVWLGRAVRVHAYVHTFFHTCVAMNEVFHTYGRG